MIVCYPVGSARGEKEEKKKKKGRKMSESALKEGGEGKTEKGVKWETTSTDILSKGKKGEVKKKGEREGGPQTVIVKRRKQGGGKKKKKRGNGGEEK